MGGPAAATPPLEKPSPQKAYPLLRPCWEAHFSFAGAGRGHGPRKKPKGPRSSREIDVTSILQDFSKITPLCMFSPKSKASKCLAGGAEIPLLPPLALPLLEHPHNWAGVSPFTLACPTHHRQAREGLVQVGQVRFLIR